jgi:hypothetical protein
VTKPTGAVLARSGGLVSRAWRIAEAHRWPVLLAWSVAWSLAHWPAHGFGWHYFARGSRILTSARGLHVFAIDPALQSGPLSFLAVTPLVSTLPPHLAEATAIALMACLGLLAIRLLEFSSRREASPSRHSVDRRSSRVLVIGLLVVPVWAELAVHWSHPDDVLAVLGLLGGLACVRSARLLAAAVLLGLAVDCKPWALLFVPVLLLAPGRKLLPAAALFGGIVAAAWVPFLLADSRTLAASAFKITIDRASVLHLAGLRGGTPSWCRSAQLVAGLALVAAAVRGKRWPAALAIGVCARMLLDPGTKNYYDAGLIVATALYDLVAAGSIPWLTLAALTAIYIPSYALASLPDERGALRLVFLLSAPVILLLRSARFEGRRGTM